MEFFLLNFFCGVGREYSLRLRMKCNKPIFSSGCCFHTAIDNLLESIGVNTILDELGIEVLHISTGTISQTLQPWATGQKVELNCMAELWTVYFTKA